MSDDSFIREVEEELRSDRFKALWKRFGPFIIGAAVLLVAATAAWRGYLAYAESRANAAGDAYLRAIELADDGQRDEALAALAEIEENGVGRYDLLARMRAASLIAGEEPQEAIAAFTAVANDAQTPPAIADVARLRAGYLLVDHGTPGEVNAMVGRLAVEGDPMRHSAREALALSALGAGDTARAAEVFREIVADRETPPGIAERAGDMLAFIRATEGPTVADGVEATAIEAVPETAEPDMEVVETEPDVVATPAASAVGAPAATTPTTVPAAE